MDRASLFAVCLAEEKCFESFIAFWIDFRYMRYKLYILCVYGYLLASCFLLLVLGATALSLVRVLCHSSSSGLETLASPSPPLLLFFFIFALQSGPRPTFPSPYHADPLSVLTISYSILAISHSLFTHTDTRSPLTIPVFLPPHKPLLTHNPQPLFLYLPPKPSHSLTHSLGNQPTI
jgi:hypothetical protein